MQIVANLYNRSVSIHCVDCFGVLLTSLNRNKNFKSILLHSYSGSYETTKRILKETKGNVFFGFSFKINSKLKNLKQTIDVIPKERIIIESDMECTNEERFSNLNKALVLFEISYQQALENFVTFIQL